MLGMAAAINTLTTMMRKLRTCLACRILSPDETITARRIRDSSNGCANALEEIRKLKVTRAKAAQIPQSRKNHDRLPFPENLAFIPFGTLGRVGLSW